MRQRVHAKINKLFSKLFSSSASPRSHTAEYRPLTSKSHEHSIGHFLMLFICGRVIKAISSGITNKSFILFPTKAIKIKRSEFELRDEIFNNNTSNKYNLLSYVRLKNY